MNLLDDIEVSKYETGIFEGFEGLVIDVGEANKLALALQQQREEELTQYVLNKINDSPSYIFPILAWSLFTEAASDLFKLSCWMLNQESFFPSDKQLLDFGLRLSVVTWRTDALEKFLSLGANPNQQVIPQRNIYDVCLNRSQHSYYSEDTKEVVDAVTALEEHNAKAFLLEKYEVKIPCFDILKTISIHDAWWTLFFTTIESDDESVQQLWCTLVSQCVNKAKKPSQKWLKETGLLVESIGKAQFVDRAISLLCEAKRPRATLIYGDLDGGPYYKASDSLKESFDLWKITQSSSLILKCLTWLLMKIDEKKAIATVFELCKAMYEKYELLGIRDVKLANACFECLVVSDEGIKLAKSLFDETTHKPTLNKMKTILATVDK